jgi:outer membrane protein assembly factor BamB
VCLAVLLSAAGAEEPPQKPAARGRGSDWPRFLGPTGDSKSSERGILTTWPAEGPPLMWQLALGAGYCMPTISSGRLFQFDRVGDRARLRALESTTAKPLWKFEYPSDFEDLYGYDNGPRCSPVVDGEHVYIFGAEGMLHCLNVADGKPVWKVDTAADFGVIQNFFGVGSTPVVEGELLIVQVGGSPPESKRIPPGRLDQVVGNGSGIVAFDKNSGAVKYQITDELASYASPTLATIQGRRWCFVFARGGLVGFEPASGKLDFRFPWRAPTLESVNASNPVVVDDLVFISETYGPGAALLRVRPGEAKVVWSDLERRRDKVMQTHWNTPIHHEGYLYASSGRHTENAELRCVELATGRVAWRQSDLTRTSLLYVDGHFVCLGEDGVLRLLRANPKKYDPVAQVVLTEKTSGPNPFGLRPTRLMKYPAWAAPILSHGLLYLRGADRLVCLELIPDSKPAP